MIVFNWIQTTRSYLPPHRGQRSGWTDGNATMKSRINASRRLSPLKNNTNKLMPFLKGRLKTHKRTSEVFQSAVFHQQQRPVLFQLQQSPRSAQWREDLFFLKRCLQISIKKNKHQTGIFLTYMVLKRAKNVTSLRLIYPSFSHI